MIWSKNEGVWRFLEQLIDQQDERKYVDLVLTGYNLQIASLSMRDLARQH